GGSNPPERAIFSDSSETEYSARYSLFSKLPSSDGGKNLLRFDKLPRAIWSAVSARRGEGRSPGDHPSERAISSDSSEAKYPARYSLFSKLPSSDGGKNLLRFDL